ncbi:DUF302 domain-containing protein [Geoalkalibacter halelectricus]|uniref:DUF302 domain-containing protein n=1 Tax=Geoalkalibacter halelectricus TaxID=2847045 RepID=UPI003D1E7E4C
MHAEIYRALTTKPVTRFVADFAQAAARRGFSIHNESKMDMAHTFGEHGAEVAEGFDLHMIQICKPQKAAKSLSKNPERAVLMPKFVMTFSAEGATQIRFLRYGRALIAEMVDDAEFPSSLEESFNDIIAVIEEAK